MTVGVPSIFSFMFFRDLVDTSLNDLGWIFVRSNDLVIE
jgi:hypothetical protein